MKVFFLWCILTVFASPILASDASFSWLPNSESNLGGYKICYGFESSSYPHCEDVLKPPTVNGKVQATLTGIPDGVAWYAAIAYDTDGFESLFSDEAVYNPIPNLVEEHTVNTE